MYLILYHFDNAVLLSEELFMSLTYSEMHTAHEFQGELNRVETGFRFDHTGCILGTDPAES